MKSYLVLLIAIIFSSISSVVAQESSFDKDAAAWHKKAIMTCGMFNNMETFSQKKALMKLDVLGKGMKELQTKYANNPPAEYKNDPMWKMYFHLFLDNTKIVKERIVEKKYKLAQSYCGNYCKLFGRMHRNNGTTNLTDIMFAMRMSIIGTMEMFSANNLEGARANLPIVKSSLVKYIKIAENNEKYNPLYKPVEYIINKWINAVEKTDKEKVRSSLDEFMQVFKKAYLSTI